MTPLADVLVTVTTWPAPTQHWPSPKLSPFSDTEHEIHHDHPTARREQAAKEKLLNPTAPGVGEAWVWREKQPGVSTGAHGLRGYPLLCTQGPKCHYPWD